MQRITIKLFGPGETRPRFVGALQVQPIGASVNDAIELSLQDLKLLWDVEHAVNEHVAGRCHVEVRDLVTRATE